MIQPISTTPVITLSQSVSTGFSNPPIIRISPYEIEFVLKEFPAIRDAVVIPSADPIRDYVPKALVTLIKGTEPSKEIAMDIMNFAKNEIVSLQAYPSSRIPRNPQKHRRRNPARQPDRPRKAKRIAGEKSTYEFWEEDSKISISDTWAQELP